MIKIYVKKQSNYPIEAVKLKKHLKKFLKKQGVSSDTLVSIALVGESKMRELGKKFLDESKNSPVHNVLSFTESEVREDFVYPPGDFMNLGEIVVCYPVAFEEAKKENKRIEKKVEELVEHGAFHLLGVHHG